MSPILGIIASSKKSAFNPTSIAGCQLWLDAADTATISLSGSAVTQWNDKSGNSRNFAQGTAGNRPLSGTRTQNGKNVIDFDGTDDRLVSSSASSTWTFLHDGSLYTLFVAVERDVTAGSQDIIGNNGNASNQTGVVLSNFSTGGINHYITRSVSGQPPVDNATGIVISGFYYSSVVANPGTGTASNRSAIRYKSGSPIQNNVQTYAPAGGSPSNDLAIGDSKGNTTNLPWNGAIGEILIYNSQLNATDLGLVNSYLAAKWGV
jgi:hypothetical protein